MIKSSPVLTIDILSAASSFVFALAIYMLLLNNNLLRQKDWVRYFAHTFLVLGVIHTVGAAYSEELRLAAEKPFDIHPGIVLLNAAVIICSGLTNYFFLLSSILLLEAMMSERWRSFVQRFLVRNSFTSPLFWICFGIALIGAINFNKHVQTPDHLVSTVALLSMGYALYRNRVKTDKVMAWVALISAIAYAILHFLQIQLIRDLENAVLSSNYTNLVNSLTERTFRNFIALILKFGFFISAFSLMLWISGPLQGIESLLKSVIHEKNEFFENEGIVKSIYNELGKIPVRLFIRLPGLKEQLLAVFEYPPAAKGEKGPRLIKYQKGTIYDKIFTKGESGRRDPDDFSFQLLTSPTEIGAPVFFHNSVIACLEVEVRGETFSEGNRINLERMANLISPAIQTYREMSALNKLSEDLAELQICVVEFNPEVDLKKITEKVFNVVSASAVGISVEIGFKSYYAVAAAPEIDAELVKKRLGEKIKKGDTTVDGTRWLAREMVIQWQDPDGKRQEQVFGNFVLALNKDADQTTHTAIGTNETFRRALSDLVSDRLLNFIRGHLNQVTDRLGTRLSGLKGATIEGWEKIVNESAGDAGLKWALANSSTNPEFDQLLDSLSSGAAFASGKPVIEKDGYSLLELKSVASEARFVIKKTFQDPDETFWFCIATKSFRDELKYISPWRYFMDHFCEIAYSALVRVQVMKREQILIRNLTFLNSVQSDRLADQNLAHSLKEVHPLRDELARLSAAVDDNSLSVSTHGPVIHDLYQRATVLSDLVADTLSVHDNNRSPCSLNEVLAEVRRLINNRLARHSIDLDDELSEECIVDLPYRVAKAALKTIIDNSIDALRDLSDKESVDRGKIQINIWTTKNKVICAVTDNGPGVPERMIPRLFTEVPESSKTNGDGIGLYLAKIWLLRFGGDIVHRRNGNLGACFLIEFPQS